MNLVMHLDFHIVFLINIVLCVKLDKVGKQNLHLLVMHQGSIICIKKLYGGDYYEKESSNYCSMSDLNDLCRVWRIE